MLRNIPWKYLTRNKGKEQTLANAEDLFSRHGVRFGQPDSTPHPGTWSVGAELPQDFIRLKLFQRLLGHVTATVAIVPFGCSIWDHLSTGSMAESRGGCGNAVLTWFRLHQPAAEPSVCGQIDHRSFRQKCPWSRYPGILCHSWMPQPPVWEPRTTGTQFSSCVLTSNR